MMQILSAGLVGLFAGVCSGVFGIGGGIILVPSLIFFFQFSQSMANGTSLVALLFPVGILGVFEYYQAGKIGMENVKLGLLISVGLFLGVFLGARLATYLPERLLTQLFAVLLILVGLKLFFGK